MYIYIDLYIYTYIYIYIYIKSEKKCILQFMYLGKS